MKRDLQHTTTERNGSRQRRLAELSLQLTVAPILSLDLVDQCVRHDLLVPESVAQLMKQAVVPTVCRAIENYDTQAQGGDWLSWMPVVEFNFDHLDLLADFILWLEGHEISCDDAWDSISTRHPFDAKLLRRLVQVRRWAT